MLPGWQPCVIVVTLYDAPNGPAVDLKIETHIPSKVRRPENDQMSTWLGRGGSNRNRANTNYDEEDSAYVAS
jgi:hypothetical protein